MAVAVAKEPKNFPCASCDCTPDGRSTDGSTWNIPGVIERSPVCLAKLVTPRSRQMLDLYRHYRNGVLPVAGGLLDQPYAYFHAMSIIDDWMNRA